MTSPTTHKRSIFSYFRFVASLGMALGIAGATALHAGPADAEPPKKSQQTNGTWSCEFDSANGGTITVPDLASEPDCTHVCKNFNENGINCESATPTFVPTPKKKAPAKRERSPRG